MKSKRKSKQKESQGKPTWIKHLPLLLVLVAGFLALDLGLFSGGDNASYLILGQSIAESGAYRDIHRPGSPPHVDHPPVYPLVLSVFHLIAKHNYFLPKLLNITLLVTLLIFFIKTLEKEDKGSFQRVLPWLGTVLGINSVLLSYSHWILAEIPYTLVSILSIYFFYQFERERRELHFFGALLLAVVAFYTRLNGLSLVAAYVLYFLFTRQFRRSAIAFLTSLVLIFPWILRYVLIRGSEAGGYYPAFTFFLKSIYDPVQGTMTLGDFLGRFGLNIVKYGTWGLGTSLLGLKFSNVTMGLGVLCLLLIIVGAWKGKHLKNRLLFIYLVLYGAIILSWPPAWTDKRFLLPIVPFLFVYIVQGLAFFLGRWTRKRKRFAVTLPLGLFGVIYLVQLIAVAPSTWNRNLRYLRGDRYATAPPGYKHLFQAAAWTRRHIRKDAIFLARKPNLFFLHSQHKAVTYPLVLDTEVLREYMEQNEVNYIVHWTSNVRDLQYIGGFAEKYPDDLSVVYSTPFPETQIVEYLPNSDVGP
jgi:hypothetical protein